MKNSEKAPSSSQLSALDRLLEIMSALRHPETGCPWDLEQTFKTIAPYAIEEAYEVADAIDRDNMQDFKEELGDLLLQVIFQSQIAGEKNIFTFDDVVTTLCEKLVYRHPHVFGEEKAANSSEVITIWNERKESEQENESAIDGVTLGLPSLLRAQKLQKKADKSGFVWPDSQSAWKKVEEELEEFKDAKTKEHQAEELGDLMFCIVNYARLSGHDTEEILTATNKKFERRFKSMEKSLSSKGKSLKDSSLEDMLDAWNDGKSL